MKNRPYNVVPCIPKAWSEGVEELLGQMEGKSERSDTTYAYFFRTVHDPRKDMPAGMLSLETHRTPQYDHRFHCSIFGKAVFLRPLSIEEMQEHDLIPDPRNHLAAVRKG